MGKREYRSSITINKDINVAELLTLGDNISLNFEYKAVLKNALSFPDSLADSDQQFVFNRALAATRKTPTREYFQKELNRALLYYVSLPLKKWQFITHIGVRLERQNPVQLGDSRLTFPARLRLDMRQHRKSIEEDAQRRLFVAPIPKHFSCVSVSCVSRTSESAFETGLFLTEYFRASCNYVTLKTWRISSPPRSPVNSILPGNVHTIYDEDGSPLENAFMYNDIHHYPASRIKSDDVVKIQEKARDLRVDVNRSRYPKILRAGLVRFSNAMDEFNWDICMIKLWGVLEMLTNTSQENAKDTIRRTCATWSSPEHHREFLEMISVQRNRYAHAGIEGYDYLEYIIFRLANYVHNMIRFHLYNTFPNSSFSLMCENLDIPTNTEELKKQIKKINERSLVLAKSLKMRESGKW